MGSMAGYDINDPPNGIALPTVANNLRYTVGGTVKKKYGKLSPDEKKQVSFAVMRTERRNGMLAIMRSRLSFVKIGQMKKRTLPGDAGIKFLTIMKSSLNC